MGALPKSCFIEGLPQKGFWRFKKLEFQSTEQLSVALQDFRRGGRVRISTPIFTKHPTGKEHLISFTIVESQSVPRPK
jgi:hypothetical protein